MKKLLSLILIFLLSFSMFLMLGQQTMAQEEFQASYSIEPLPLIDGIVTAQEWSDANSYLISLSGAAGVVPATVYFKHNGIDIYLGLIVEADDHTTDEFAVFFDEGDDGLYGSGTRDGVLTNNQEDVKACWSPPPAGYTIEDGCYEDGAWYGFWGGDFDAACVFVDDHWEVEFAIPFVGNDDAVGTPEEDVSDLVCGITDTIGIKIQYFTQPDANNYFYPAGDQAEIETYTALSFEQVFVPPGEDITVYPHPDVVLTFDEVLTGGEVYVTTSYEGPPGYPFEGYGPYYYIEANPLTFTTVSIGIHYDETELTKPETELTLWRFDPAVLVDGDVNGNGRVDFIDLLRIVFSLGSRPGRWRWNPACDINGDLKVNFIDLLIAIMNFGKTSTPAGWTDITDHVDVVNNIVYGDTDHFSPYRVH